MTPYVSPRNAVPRGFFQEKLKTKQKCYHCSFDKLVKDLLGKP